MEERGKRERAPYYRDLVVWQKAMELARIVYSLAPRLPREETYGMRSQLTRAVVFVPANIAEGWARESRPEKAQFLAIAQGSLAEADTLRTLCEQLDWFPPEDTQRPRQLMEEVSRMLTALRRKMRGEERGNRKENRD